MRKTLIAIRSFFVIFILSGYLCLAQGNINKIRQAEIVRDICVKLEKYYTFPEVGLKLSKAINEKFEKDGYSENVTVNKFLEELNSDLHDLSNDNHLKLFFNPQLAKELSDTSNQAGNEKYENNQERWLNYGFKELKILDGQIGYLNLTDFCSAKYGGDKAVAAMNYFSDCNALIIDLRENGGGNDEMVTFLSSYFIDSNGSVLFGITLSTISGNYYSSVIPAYVPGKRLADIPVYLLTSGATASAAEAVVSVLKYYNKNVTVIGGKTRGAENPINELAVSEEYILRIPSWRQIYSAFNAKWEGIGITPDIQKEFKKTLPFAYLEALKKIKDKVKNSDEAFLFQWAFDRAKALNEPFPVDVKLLKSYAGNYGSSTIHFAAGTLYYGLDKLRMIPITENYFLVESADYHRIKFIVENEKVVALERIFVYGYTARRTRN